MDEGPADPVAAQPDPGLERGAAPGSWSSDSMPRWLPRAIGLVFVSVILLAAGSYLLTRLHELLLTLVVSLFLSFALEPAVDSLNRRGWRRGSATALVLVVMLGTLLIFFGLIGKLVVDQVRQFIDQAPAKSENLERWINRTFGTHLSNRQISKEFSDPNGPIRNFATHLAGNALGFSLSVLDVIFRFFTILLFTFYLVADGPRFRRLICSFLRPDRQREVLANWEVAIQKTGGYLYSRLLLGIIQAIGHYIAFVVIGVPYPLALALFVGVVSQFVPVVGTYIANVFPALVALSVDPVKALWVVLFAIVFQQIENYFAAPRITARTMSLHPAVAFGSVLAGVGLFGPVGAIIALPAAAVFQAVGSAYFERHEVVESHMTAEPTRRRGVAEEPTRRCGGGRGPPGRRRRPRSGTTPGPVRSGRFDRCSLGSPCPRNEEHKMAIANPALNEKVFDKEMGPDARPGWAAPGGPTGGTGTIAPEGYAPPAGSAPTPAPGTTGWGGGETRPPFETTGDTRTMTLGGTFTATLVLFVLLLCGAWVGWQNVSQTKVTSTDAVTGQTITQYSLHFPGWIMFVMLAAFGLAMVTIFKPKLARVTSPIYALGEGVALGAISAAFNLEYQGIVLQAVMATMSVFAVMLFLYATRLVRVTERMRRIVLFSMLGIIVMYLVSFVASWIGGSVPFIDNPTPLGIGISVVIVVVASMNLMLNFDFIERAVLARSPRYMEWYGAFGLMIALVWLYLEILRLLALLRRR